MDNTIVVALLSLLGTAFGSIGGVLTANRLTNYRIEQLEKQVEKHNKVVDRTYELEKDVSLAFQMIDEEKTQISQLRKDLDKIVDK